MTTQGLRPPFHFFSGRCGHGVQKLLQGKAAGVCAASTARPEGLLAEPAHQAKHALPLATAAVQGLRAHRQGQRGWGCLRGRCRGGRQYSCKAASLLQELAGLFVEPVPNGQSNAAALDRWTTTCMADAHCHILPDCCCTPQVFTQTDCDLIFTKVSAPCTQA